MIINGIHVLTVKRIMVKLLNVKDMWDTLFKYQLSTYFVYPVKDNQICLTQVVEWEYGPEVTRSCVEPDSTIFPFFENTSTDISTVYNDHTNCHDWEMMGGVRRCLHFCDTGMEI